MKSGRKRKARCDEGAILKPVLESPLSYSSMVSLHTHLIMSINIYYTVKKAISISHYISDNTDM